MNNLFNIIYNYIKHVITQVILYCCFSDCTWIAHIFLNNLAEEKVQGQEIPILNCLKYANCLACARAEVISCEDT